VDLQVNRKGYTCVRCRVDTDTVQLIGFGDLHIGASTYNEGKATEVREYIRNKNCIWIGMGDFIENASKKSIGAGVYEQLMTPKEQITYLRSFLEPIKDKCIGYLRGNHEERSYKDSGIDVADIVCYELGLPYCDWEFFGIVAGQKRSWKVYAVHSYMASKTAGLALNATENNIEKMLGDVDIIFRGHTHKRIVHLNEWFQIDARNNTVKVRQRANVIIGHFLERDKSYAAARPMRGDPAGTIALELKMHKDTTREITPIYI
jgi:hypothetical protein